MTRGRGYRFSLGKHQVEEDPWPECLGKFQSCKRRKLGQGREKQGAVWTPRFKMCWGLCQLSQMSPPKKPPRARLPCLPFTAGTGMEHSLH